MTIRLAWLAMVKLLTLSLLSQTSIPVPSKIIKMDDEPHHHLVFKNDAVGVFETNFASHDALPMHAHDHAEVVVAMTDATTVSTSPGKADILQMYKNGAVYFSSSGTVHSVRNIGASSYRALSMDLLSAQTGARNLCGRQIQDLPLNCPVAPADNPNAPSVDIPQFETDQTRVVLTRIHVHQLATFGEKNRDTLIVAIDKAEMSIAGGKDSYQTLADGEPVWIPKGRPGKIVRNMSDKDLIVVSVSLAP